MWSFLCLLTNFLYFFSLGGTYEDWYKMKLKRINKSPQIPGPEALYGHMKWLTFGFSLSLSLFLLISLSPPSLLPSLCPSEVERYQIGLVLDSSSGSPLLGCMYLDNVFQNSWSLLSQICSGKRNLCSNQPSSEVQQLKQM